MLPPSAEPREPHLPCLRPDSEPDFFQLWLDGLRQLDPDPVNLAALGGLPLLSARAHHQCQTQPNAYDKLCPHFIISLFRPCPADSRGFPPVEHARQLLRP